MKVLILTFFLSIIPVLSFAGEEEAEQAYLNMTNAKSYCEDRYDAWESAQTSATEAENGVNEARLDCLTEYPSLFHSMVDYWDTTFDVPADLAEGYGSDYHNTANGKFLQGENYEDMGNIAYNAGNYSTAVEQYEQAMYKFNDSRGWIDMSTEKYEIAIDLYDSEKQDIEFWISEYEN